MYGKNTFKLFRLKLWELIESDRIIQHNTMITKKIEQNHNFVDCKYIWDDNSDK